VLGSHRCPHPWLFHDWRRRQIILRQRIRGPPPEEGVWSSPAFPGEGIVVVTAVQAVGRGGGAAVGDSFDVAALGAGGVLASVC